MLQKVIALIFCALNVQHGPSQRCTLNARLDFRETVPVVLKNQQYLEPTNPSGDIEMSYGESLTLSCEGSGSIVHPLANTQLSTAEIFCRSGVTFENSRWLEGPAVFSSFSCPNFPNYMSWRTNRTCYDDNPVIEVGYKVQNDLYPLYESCFGTRLNNVLYTKYTQRFYNANFQPKVRRPQFIANDVYGHVPVEYLFSPKSQKASVERLVGSIINRYINNNEFLARGHLAAKTDYVFAFGQRATFHYVNCAPQWDGFNGGNWNTLEVDLRNHINSMGYDTVIYTGTFGITQLNDEYGNKIDIYLTTDDNNNPIIPVPLYFYKVVHETNSRRAIVFVGINNPYYEPNEARDLFFCTDLCRNNIDFSWLSWSPDNPKYGYSFCCSVDDFRITVPHLPDFEVRGLFY